MSEKSCPVASFSYMAFFLGKLYTNSAVYLESHLAIWPPGPNLCSFCTPFPFHNSARPCHLELKPCMASKLKQDWVQQSSLLTNVISQDVRMNKASRQQPIRAIHRGSYRHPDNIFGEILHAPTHVASWLFWRAAPWSLCSAKLGPWYDREWEGWKVAAQSHVMHRCIDARNRNQEQDRI